MNTKFLPVASWTKVGLYTLSDIEGLQSEMEQALQYGVLHATEQFLLDGYATAGITGLTNTLGLLART